MAAELKAKVTLNSTAFSRGLRKLKGMAKSFGKNFGRPIAEATKKIVKFGAAAAAAAAAGLATVIKGTAKFEDKMDKMSKRTGISVKTLSALSHVAKLSGGSIDGLEKGVQKMSTTIYEANRNTSTYVDALNDLNLSAKDFEGLSPDKSFLKILKAMGNLPDVTKRSALAMRIFGRAGNQLLPMINGLEANMKKSKRLGLVIDKKQAASAASFNDSISDLIGSIKGLGLQGLDFSGLIAGVNRMTEAVVYFRKSAKFEGLKKGFTETANSVVSQSGRMITVWGKLQDSTKTITTIIVRGLAVALIGGITGINKILFGIIAGSVKGIVSIISAGIAGIIAVLKEPAKYLPKTVKALSFVKKTLKDLFGLKLFDLAKTFGEIFIPVSKGLLSVSKGFDGFIRALRVATRLASAGSFYHVFELEAYLKAANLIREIAGDFKLLGTISLRLLDALTAIDTAFAGFSLGETLQEYYGAGSKLLDIFKKIGITIAAVQATSFNLYKVIDSFDPNVTGFKKLIEFAHALGLEYDKTYNKIEKFLGLDFSYTPSSGTREDRLDYLADKYNKKNNYFKKLLSWLNYDPVLSALQATGDKITDRLKGQWNEVSRTAKKALKPIKDAFTDIKRTLNRTRVEEFIKPLEDIDLGKLLKLKDLTNSISNFLPKIPLPGEKEAKAIDKITSSVDRLKNAMKNSSMSRGMFSDFQQKLLDWKNNPNRKKKDKPDFNKSPYSIASRNKMWNEAMKKAKEADKKATEKLIKEHAKTVYDQEEKTLKSAERKKYQEQTQSHLTNNKKEYNSIKSNLTVLKDRYNEARNKKNFYEDQIKKTNAARELDQKDKAQLQEAIKEYEKVQASEKLHHTPNREKFLSSHKEDYEKSKAYLEKYKKQDVEYDNKLKYLKTQVKQSGKNVSDIRSEYAKQHKQAIDIQKDSEKTRQEYIKKTAPERAEKAASDYFMYIRHGRLKEAGEALEQFKKAEGIGEQLSNGKLITKNRPLISGPLSKYFPNVSSFDAVFKKGTKYGPRLSAANVGGATDSIAGQVKQLVDLTKTNNTILSTIADKNPPVANWV